jgi:hypothetical protein
MRRGECTVIDLGLKRLVVGLSLFAVVVAGGCAKGSQTSGGGGTAGEGASGEGAAPAGGTGGSGAASTGGGTTTSDTTSTTDTMTTSTTSTSGSGTCASGQHECSGQCFGNTPESGCLQAPPGCTPCPQPANGASSCTVAGACDFSCGTGYSKQSGACVCDTACCKDADCASGQTCQGGTCSAGGGGAGGGGACDDATCFSDCFMQCLLMGKVGIGACVGGACNCQCM